MNGDTTGERLITKVEEKCALFTSPIVEEHINISIVLTGSNETLALCQLKEHNMPGRHKREVNCKSINNNLLARIYLSFNYR